MYSVGSVRNQQRFAAFTIASKRYLALARVTASSFLKHNPNIPFFLLLSDEEDGSIDFGSDPFIVIRQEQLSLPEPDQFRFRYTELEFSYALTPYVINHLFEQGFKGVLFLKQETLVLDELTSVLSMLGNASVLLTPHFLVPPQRPDALQQEMNVCLAGIFNGGFLAFTNCDESRQFLTWWQRKTLNSCVRDFANGLHFEQRWLDFVPSLMPHYRVVRDPGVNVGHWNLPEREIKFVDGKVSAKGAKCRVFRFSGYEVDKPEQVTKHNVSFRVSDTGEAAEIFALYRQMLLDADHEAMRQCAYAYDTYDNGIGIDDLHRSVYLQLGHRARQFGNPFLSASPGSYYQWLMTRMKGHPT